MFKIKESRMIVPNLHLLVVEAPAVARQAQPGQFVIVRADEDSERIPLSISDWDVDQSTISIVVMNIGASTSRLASLKAGQSMATVVGPLGNATEIDHYGTVLCLAGCYGIGSIYPIARALKARGNKVITVIEGRSSFLLYFEDKFKKVSDRVICITRDGSKGYRGHVGLLEEIIRSLNEPVHRVIINGCTFLMMRGSEVTKPLGIKTLVSLNPIMIDGTGMCGVCRVTVGSTTRFACVHGPDFDGHEVNWTELLQRRKTYMNEENVPLTTSRCEEHSRKLREEDHA